MTYRGIDLTPFITLMLTGIGAVLTYFQKRTTDSKVKADAAAEQLSRAQLAMIRVGAIGMAMVRDLWEELSREFQIRIADGTLDVEDRKALRYLVEGKLKAYVTDEDELKKLAEALGLPMPGIVAKITEFIIDRLTKAHDPDILEVATAAYPISPAPEPEEGSTTFTVQTLPESERPPG